MPETPGKLWASRMPWLTLICLPCALFQETKESASSIITVLTHVYMVTVDEESGFLYNLEAGQGWEVQVQVSAHVWIKTCSSHSLFLGLLEQRLLPRVSQQSHGHRCVTPAFLLTLRSVTMLPEQPESCEVLPKAMPCLWNMGEFYSVRGWNPHGQERFHGNGPVGLAPQSYIQNTADASRQSK